MLRRIDTFDLVFLLYASLLRISKAKTLKRALLQTDNFFQSSNENATCLTRTQIKIKLDVFANFLKKSNNICLDFKTTIILFDLILQFWRTQTLYLFFKLLSANNQQLFCVTESNIGQVPSNHTPPLYELLAPVLWFALTFGEVSETCRRMP